MLAFECANPLWGRTLNPHAPAYTCGGSSGGEAALLAASGAVLGLGSDVGGSLRIPASYCGIYSFKPGHGRVPYGGAKCASYAQHYRPDGVLTNKQRVVEGRRRYVQLRALWVGAWLISCARHVCYLVNRTREERSRHSLSATLSCHQG
jgi:hypothetical protein